MLSLRDSILCIAVVASCFCVSESALAGHWHHGPRLKSVEISPGRVVGGSADVVTGTVTLNEPADAAGDVVTLTSSNPAVASVPANVTVLGGTTSATFTVTTVQVNFDKNVRVRADFGDRHRERELKVHPFRIASFSFDPSTVVGGSVFGGVQQSVGSVMIDAPAGSAGLTVNVTSNNDAFGPTPVVIPAGMTTGTFTVIPMQVSVTTYVWFTAAVGSRMKHALLTIVPPSS